MADEWEAKARKLGETHFVLLEGGVSAVKSGFYVAVAHELKAEFERGAEDLKARIAKADPIHFCNECGTEFLSCCHEHIKLLSEAE